MYAVIETGGKQYQVSEGDEIFIEKLPVEADAAVSFDKVIAIGAESGLTVGTPYVAGATVEAKVLKNGKAKKITVFTYKPKKNAQLRWCAVRTPDQRTCRFWGCGLRYRMCVRLLGSTVDSQHDHGDLPDPCEGGGVGQRDPDQHPAAG